MRKSWRHRWLSLGLAASMGLSPSYLSIAVAQDTPPAQQRLIEPDGVPVYRGRGPRFLQNPFATQYQQAWQAYRTPAQVARGGAIPSAGYPNSAPRQQPAVLFPPGYLPPVAGAPVAPVERTPIQGQLRIAETATASEMPTVVPQSAPSSTSSVAIEEKVIDRKLMNMDGTPYELPPGAVVVEKDIASVTPRESAFVSSSTAAPTSPTLHAAMTPTSAPAASPTVVEPTPAAFDGVSACEGDCGGCEKCKRGIGRPLTKLFAPTCKPKADVCRDGSCSTCEKGVCRVVTKPQVVSKKGCARCVEHGAPCQACGEKACETGCDPESAAPVVTKTTIVNEELILPDGTKAPWPSTKREPTPNVTRAVDGAPTPMKIHQATPIKTPSTDLPPSLTAPEPQDESIAPIEAPLTSRSPLRVTPSEAIVITSEVEVDDPTRPSSWPIQVTERSTSKRPSAPLHSKSLPSRTAKTTAAIGQPSKSGFGLFGMRFGGSKPAPEPRTAPSLRARKPTTPTAVPHETIVTQSIAAIEASPPALPSASASRQTVRLSTTPAATPTNQHRAALGERIAGSFKANASDPRPLDSTSTGAGPAIASTPIAPKTPIVFAEPPASPVILVRDTAPETTAPTAKTADSWSNPIGAQEPAFDANDAVSTAPATRISKAPAYSSLNPDIEIVSMTEADSKTARPKVQTPMNPAPPLSVPPQVLPAAAPGSPGADPPRSKWLDSPETREAKRNDIRAQLERPTWRPAAAFEKEARND